MVLKLCFHNFKYFMPNFKKKMYSKFQMMLQNYFFNKIIYIYIYIKKIYCASTMILFVYRSETNETKWKKEMNFDIKLFDTFSFL